MAGQYPNGGIFRGEAASASDYIFADVGARISIRQFRAAPGPRTFLQRLDAVKYTKIVEAPGH